MSRRQIGFLLHPGEQHAVEAGAERARELGYDVWVEVREPETTMAAHAADTDLLVTIGGDGTFLFGARLAAPRAIPVMGVNRGRLGFLTDVEVADLPAALDAFAGGRYHTQRRSMLEATVPGDSDTPRWQALALNEVAVKSGGVSVARIRVEEDGELLGEFDADGLVVATATGSTAYALSAGGPPIDPRVRAVVVVPLAPHAVISRAIVLPEMVTLRVTVERGRVNLAADGLAETRLRDGAEMVIRPGPELAYVRFDDSPSFLRRLRDKVRFGLPLKDLERPSLRRPPDATDTGPAVVEARP
ncbi:MAG: NAD(+)/NADH kinase [Candidatus Dormibacteraeota bacterium]|uniref:NAD kinase n=1 Tax=Candidatus Amunia macphersoniae TaxID=3127014 RepID=A0A934KJX4_9BACT|nr:NAD(+)/NADH kinase [Candidatus Dormibacteraeota bacterium]